jgi:uroporphyrinogen III methyltransferase / synthase
VPAARGASRPLEGRTVVVTRPAPQAASLATPLIELGARVLEAPVIAIAPPSSWAPLDAALDALPTFAWIVFTSVNGVKMVGERLGRRGIPWSAIGARRVAAIGPATARSLAAEGVPAEVVPDEYRAEALVTALADRVRPGDRVLLPRAAKTRDVLVVGLSRAGVEVVEVAAYVTHPVGSHARRLRAALAEGGVDAVTFTSSSTARGFAELLSTEERGRWLRGVTIASIGPITAATAAEYGLSTDVMPAEYTIPALVRAVAEHFEALPLRGRKRSA